MGAEGDAAGSAVGAAGTAVDVAGLTSDGSTAAVPDLHNRNLSQRSLPTICSSRVFTVLPVGIEMELPGERDDASKAASPGAESSITPGDVPV